MKRFECVCGQRVFFDNTTCLSCGRGLAFDPWTLQIEALRDLSGGVFETTDGRRVRLCRNTLDYGNCNWVIDAASGRQLCRSCGLNEMIPNLDRVGNLHLWSNVERSKRRMLYTLLVLALPVPFEAAAGGLRFRILEDQRRNPDVDEDFVATGHLDGLVTVNLAEADDVSRTEAQRDLFERYRTVLGHLRHEAGHYYFRLLTADDGMRSEVRELFGDERVPYGDALRAYYDEGPRHDWSVWHLSPYASAHPFEDFAETFAHYLHIVDALETAEEAGFRAGQVRPGAREPDWIDRWMELSITLNELNRSLGKEDPYPFVLSTPIREKLRLMDRLVRRPA